MSESTLPNNSVYILLAITFSLDKSDDECKEHEPDSLIDGLAFIVADLLQKSQRRGVEGL